MSYKAYLMKLKDRRDASILSEYVDQMDDVAFFHCIYRVDEQIDGTLFEPGDVVAATTIDRGDLIESFTKEAEICDVGEVPYHLIISEEPIHSRLVPEERGYRIYGMTIDDSANLDNVFKENEHE